MSRFDVGPWTERDRQRLERAIWVRLEPWVRAALAWALWRLLPAGLIAWWVAT